MTNCILCNKETEGSVGAAGIKWSCICQSCKDIEDKILLTKLMGMDKVIEAIFGVKEELVKIEEAIRDTATN